METETYTHKLVSFLYILLRDHLPSGVVEQIVYDVYTAEDIEYTRYTNGWLASYAKDIADRLEQV